MQHSMSQDLFNAADYFLDRNIRQGRGHKVAVYTEHRNYTYNDIQKMSNKTANGLRGLGIGIEDRVHQGRRHTHPHQHNVDPGGL